MPNNARLQRWGDPRTLLAAAILLLLAPGLSAQDEVPVDEYEGKIVQSIEFVGAELASPESVRARMKTKIGKPLRRAELNEDVKALVEELKLFSSVSQRLLPEGSGVKVQFFVAENPRIGSIFFIGNLEYTREELVALIDSKEGGLADDITLKLDEQRIREKYLTDGFHFIQVAYKKVIDKFTTIVFDITEGPEVSVEEVRFTGNKSFEKDDLLEAMPTTDEGGFLSSHAYVERDFQADLVTLAQFYRGKGFLDAEVSLLDRTFSLDKEEVVLTIKVDEGQPYLVKSVTIEGMTRFLPDDIKKEMKTRPGGRYEPHFGLGEDRRLIEKKYFDEAFINVLILNESKLPVEGHDVDVVITIQEGERARVGDVKFEGNVETRDKVLRRHLEDLVPGAPLNLNTLNRAQSRLIQLRYFDPASIAVLKPDINLPDFHDYQSTFLTVEDTDRENIKDILVKVDEVDTGSIRFAVGVNSNAGLVGAIVYRKDNFDPFDFPESFDDFFDAFTGGGQSLEIAFYPGILLTQFSISYSHPFIFDSDFSFDTSAFRRLRIRERHDESRTGFQVGVGRRFGFNIAASIRYRFEYVDVDDIDDDAPQIVFDFEGERLISSLILGLRIADLDSFQSPGEGYRTNLTYEFAGLGGDIGFHKIFLEAEYYQTLHVDAEDRKHVLFFLGKFGYVKESDTRDVPIYERLFAGGQNSIRGFSFRGVGPMENNAPVGGKALLIGSLNYSFPIYERLLGGVFFVDTGSLASELDEDLTDFRVAVGFGIRLRIDFLGPVPFAIDFGIPLIKQDDDDTQIISFSLDRRF